MIFFAKLLKKINFPEISPDEIDKIRINFVPPFSLKIIFPSLPPVKIIENLFYCLYEKFRYLFNYLDYKVEINYLFVKKEDIQDYLQLIYYSPFLQKKFGKINSVFEKWNLLEKLNFYDNNICLSANHKSLNVSKIELKSLKKLLESLGLINIHFKIKVNSPIIIQKKIISKKSPSNLNDLKNKKLIEFGIHTKFSTLDGISSPNEYIDEALKKNYSALVITDHYNIQSFPEFWQYSKNNALKIIYGCEFEVLENKFPLCVFNSFPKDSEILKTPIESLTYAVFDLETTGLFPNCNEIIQIGYVIWKNGQILQDEKREYLVRPKKPIPPEVFQVWYPDIEAQEIQDSPYIEKILLLIKSHWEKLNVQFLVAHNAYNFDFPFLNKVWKEKFGKELPYPIVDTLPLSWLVFPERRSYSLEKLSQSTNKNKLKQSHRALADSELLTDLLIKLVKILKEEKKIEEWNRIGELLKDEIVFRNRGYKVKVIARNQKGLNSLYQLVTLSHTKNFYRNPRIFLSDLLKYRKDLIIGASGSIGGEIFSSFFSFDKQVEKKRKMIFYDYIEVNSPGTFQHLWLNGQIGESDLRKTLIEIIKMADLLGIPVVASNNVHYCKPEQKILKEIVVANEGMNGRKHQLYNFATLENKEDRFKNLPEQHLLSKEEMINNWKFLRDNKLMEKLIFFNPQKIIDKVEDIVISNEKIKYPFFLHSEQDLENAFQTKSWEIFGKNLPSIVKERIEKEWEIIKKNYLSIYWLSHKIVQKTHNDKQIIGSRGSVGCSFIAYLCQITDINPLPPYKFCEKCKYFEVYSPKVRIFSCYDYQERENCPNCNLLLKIEGHDLPFETFFGWNGEKIPDIDLNFSGEYQKNVHDYVRELIGNENVYRIGTINKLSQQTTEIFLKEYKILRKKLNSGFNSYINDEEKIVEQLKGIKRTTGQHPGGLLIVPQEIDIYSHTPLNYPADNLRSEWLTTHFEYSFLAKIFLKLDILGHDEPTVLQKLFELTGKNPADIDFSDKMVMKVFTNADTLGIPEFGTDFVKKSFLKPFRPNKFSQLVQISGFSHGTDVWSQNQQTYWNKGDLVLEELIACREDIKTFLESQGLDKEDAFIASEYIRKTKWDELSEEIKKKIREKLQIGEENTNKEIEKINYLVEKLKEKESGELVIEKEKIVNFSENLSLYKREIIQWIEQKLELNPKNKNLLPKDWKKEILKESKGQKYYNILSKIKYIFPKAHAISYTITAWKVAYYKLYFPQEFYSVLLTYHATIYDIWLMTLNSQAIFFRLENLSKTLTSAKNSVKELISIIKVLQQLVKEKKEILKNSLTNSSGKAKESIETSLSEFQKKLFDVLSREKDEKEILIIIKILKQFKFGERELKSKIDKLLLDQEKKDYLIKEIGKRNDFREWKMTTKEKELIFTLKIILEIQAKGFIFSQGIDFNNSEIKNFKIVDNKILIPFMAVSGIGEKIAEKIISYRQENKKISNWKEELRGLLNKNHLEQLENLEKYNLLIN